MAKQKMASDKKIKLIYSGELLLIALVFLVIATLEIVRVMKIRDWVAIVFNWVTIFGGAWLIADFIWTLVSKRKRARNSLLDKVLALPLGIYLIVFDIICFSKMIAKVEIAYDFRLYMMTAAFYYISAIYIFQSIYHYYRPIPSIKELIAQADEEEEEPKEIPSDEEKK